MDFTSLPNDLKFEILTYLEVADVVLRARYVCHEWKSLVDLNSMWKILCYKSFKLEDFFFRLQEQPPSNMDWRTFYTYRAREVRLYGNYPDLHLNKDGTQVDRGYGSSIPIQIKTISNYRVLISNRGFKGLEESDNNQKVKNITMDSKVHKMRLRYNCSMSPDSCYCGVAVCTVPVSTIGEVRLSANNGISFSTAAGEIYVNQQRVSISSKRDPNYNPIRTHQEIIDEISKNPETKQKAVCFNTSYAIARDNDIISVQLELSEKLKVAFVIIYLNDKEVGHAYLDYAPTFYFAITMWPKSKFTILLP